MAFQNGKATGNWTVRLIWPALAAVYLLGVAGYVYWSHQRAHHHLGDTLDTYLQIGAAAVSHLIPTDYHDRAVDADAIDDAEHRAIMDRLSKYADDADLLHAYSFLQVGDDLYLTARNASPNESAPYFERWDDAPPEAREALKTGRPTHGDSMTERGAVRFVFVPFESPDGHRYAVGVDCEVVHAHAFLQEELSATLGAAVMAFVAAAPLFIAFAWLSRRNTRRLRQSEERLRLFFDRQLVGMAFTSPEKGWIQANDQVCRMLGYPWEELREKTWAELTHPDDLAADVAQFKRMLGGEIEEYSLEKRFLRKDGTTVYTNLSVGCVRKRNGTVDYVLALLEDITERKEAERSFRESAETFRSFFTSSPMGIYLYELEEDDRLVLVGANPASDRLTGVANAPLIGKTIEEAFPPLAETEIPDRYRRAARDGESWFTEQVAYDHGGICGAFEVHVFQMTPGKAAVLFLEITDRKRAEAAMRESQALLEAVLEQSTVPMVIVTPDGVVAKFNKACAEQLRIEEGSDIRPGVRLMDMDRPWKEYDAEGTLVPAEDLPLARALRGEVTAASEWRVVHPDGAEQWKIVTAAPIHGPDGEIIAAFTAFPDVTDLKRAQDSLRDSEERLRILFEKAADAIYVGDMKGRFVQVNEQACRITGCTREELLQRTVLDLDADIPNQEAVEAFLASLVGEEPQTIEARHRRKDGSIFPAEVTVAHMDTPEGSLIMGVTRDITDRKRVEHELEAHRERLEELVGARTAELRKTLADLETAQQQIIQSEKMAVLGRLAAGVAHEVNNPLGAIAAAGNMMSRSADKLVDVVLRTRVGRDDEERPVIDDLLTTAASAADVDLSTRERRRMRNQMMDEYADRDSAVVRKLAETIIDLGLWEERDRFARLLHVEDVDEILDLARSLKAVRRGGEIIDTATNRAAKIVFALKTYAHPGAGDELESVHVQENIDSVLLLYASNKSKDVKIVRDYGEPAFVEGRKEELHQIWTNLIHNAFDAIDGPGKLTITVRDEEPMVAVQVADTGGGMPLNVRDKVFEPFFTTKEAGKGCGLGLDIVKQIVDRHHGEIEVDSAEGVGTTFTIRLPIHQHEPVAESMA